MICTVITLGLQETVRPSICTLSASDDSSLGSLPEPFFEPSSPAFRNRNALVVPGKMPALTTLTTMLLVVYVCSWG